MGCQRPIWKAGDYLATLHNLRNLVEKIFKAAIDEASTLHFHIY